MSTTPKQAPVPQNTAEYYETFREELTRPSHREYQLRSQQFSDLCRYDAMKSGMDPDGRIGPNGAFPA